MPKVMRALFKIACIISLLTCTVVGQEQSRPSGIVSLPDKGRQLFGSAETPVKDSEARALSASAQVEQGNQFFKRASYPKAIEHYQSAIAFDPSFFQAYYNLGVTYVDSRRYPEAALTFKQALA